MKKSDLLYLTNIGLLIIIIIASAYSFKDILNIDTDFLVIFYIIIALILIYIVICFLGKTELDKFWEQTDFRYKNKYPEVLNPYDCEKGKNIKVYKVKMPVGMCKSDFVAKREHLEQYLNAQVKFEFIDNLQVTIDRNKKPLP